jgi:hypothetical protein
MYYFFSHIESSAKGNIYFVKLTNVHMETLKTKKVSKVLANF